jgi:hypothetical protein
VFCAQWTVKTENSVANNMLTFVKSTINHPQ